jgi:DNA modification methylase
MAEWNYGDAYLRHPILGGQTAQFEDGSAVKVHNIFDPLPDFMRCADLLFVDPPWNLGNLNTFYTKANRTDKQDDFKLFYTTLFARIAEIVPKTCYVEVGKEYLAEFIIEMKELYPIVTFYNSTYYHKKGSLCYVIRGGNKRKKLPFDGMDEEDIISWIAEHEDYNVIGDLCMGRGLVGIHAHKNGKRFVGTELNGKRLSVLLEKISNADCKYTIASDKREE